jgi:hypothetical protein
MLGSFRQVRAVFFRPKSAAPRLALVLATAGAVPPREAAMAELISDVPRGVFSPVRAGKPVDVAVCASSHSGDWQAPIHHRISSLGAPSDIRAQGYSMSADKSSMSPRRVAPTSKFTNRTFSVCRPPSGTPMNCLRSDLWQRVF